MDINKLIKETTTEYMPLALKSSLESGEAEKRDRLGIKLDLYKLIKTSFMEALTKKPEIQALLVKEGLVTLHKEMAEKNGKQVEVDVPDQSMEERLSMIPEKFTQPILEELVKSHEENIKIFSKNNDSRIDREKFELEILEQFLPKRATEEDIISYLKENYSNGISDPKMMGKIIGEVKRNFERVDGGMIAKCVKDLIAKS